MAITGHRLPPKNTSTPLCSWSHFDLFKRAHGRSLSRTTDTYITPCQVNSWVQLCGRGHEQFSQAEETKEASVATAQNKATSWGDLLAQPRRRANKMSGVIGRRVRPCPPAWTRATPAWTSLSLAMDRVMGGVREAPSDLFKPDRRRVGFLGTGRQPPRRKVTHKATEQMLTGWQRNCNTIISTKLFIRSKGRLIGPPRRVLYSLSTIEVNCLVQAGEVHCALVSNRSSVKASCSGVGVLLALGTCSRKELRRLREKSSANLFSTPGTCSATILKSKCASKKKRHRSRCMRSWSRLYREAMTLTIAWLSDLQHTVFPSQRWPQQAGAISHISLTEMCFCAAAGGHSH